MNRHKRMQLREADSLLMKAKNIISSVKDMEQETIDNFPENLQGSERCSAMEDAVDRLEDAIDSIDEACENISKAM